MSNTPLADDPVSILRKARGQLAKGWCRDYFAMTSDGHSTFWDTRGAVRFCALGAIYKFARHQHGPLSDAVLAILHGAIPHESDDPRESIPRWNNAEERTPEEILAAFDKAAEQHERSAGFAYFRAHTLGVS